ncbi:MAG TPA: tetratricopeptide repeat protein [Gemmatimonadaceae bacterium]|nr:tetratricopeptide repeat protein [Gemmatimonadaceae bacterium]
MADTATARPAARRVDDDGSAFFDWIRQHSRIATYVGITLLAVVVATYMWRRSAAIKEQRAEQALMSASRTFGSGNLPLAQSDLEKLIVRYGSTNSGAQGRLLLAQILFEQNKVDSGLKVLETVGGGPGGAFVASVHALRAAGLEQLSKPAEAAAEYERAAETAHGTVERDMYRADAARAYTTAGQKEKALQIWQTLANDERSPMQPEAKLRIGELTAKPVS